MSCDGRHSYVEGRLRLAEKERQRMKSKSAAGGAQAGPSEEELAALEAQANANMAALLEEEEVKKVLPDSDLPFNTIRVISAGRM